MKFALSCVHILVAPTPFMVSDAQRAETVAKDALALLCFKDNVLEVDENARVALSDEADIKGLCFTLAVGPWVFEFRFKPLESKEVPR